MCLKKVMSSPFSTPLKVRRREKVEIAIAKNLKIITFNLYVRSVNT